MEKPAPIYTELRHRINAILEEYIRPNMDNIAKLTDDEVTSDGRESRLDCFVTGGREMRDQNAFSCNAMPETPMMLMHACAMSCFSNAEP